MLRPSRGGLRAAINRPWVNLTMAALFAALAVDAWLNGERAGVAVGLAVVAINLWAFARHRRERVDRPADG